MQRMYELLLATCEPFNQATDDRFAERMQEVVLLQQDCIGDQLWLERSDYTQKLRDSGQLKQVFALLMGLVDRDVAKTIWVTRCPTRRPMS